MASEAEFVCGKLALLDPKKLARFEGKFLKEDGGCWLWTGLTDIRGYGLFHVDRMSRRAHRVSYETYVGPIPHGMTIDHLCRVVACVNPEHLEPITRSENTRRSNNIFMQNARKTHCVRGHEFTDENTYRTRRGYRGCMECRGNWSSSRGRSSRPCDHCEKWITEQNYKRHVRNVHGLRMEKSR